MGMSECVGHYDHPDGNGAIAVYDTAGAIDQPYCARPWEVFMSGSGYTHQEAIRDCIKHMRVVIEQFEKSLEDGNVYKSDDEIEADKSSDDRGRNGRQNDSTS